MARLPHLILAAVIGVLAVPAAAGAASLSPDTSTDFGTVPAGTLSAPAKFTYTAGATGTVLRVTADDPAFVVVADACTGESLADTEHCDFWVRFASYAENASSGHVLVRSSGEPTASADVNGTGGPMPKGDTGAEGPKGDKGDTGLTGPQGDQGLKGDTGSQGPKGDQGDAGAKGDNGDTGAAGPKGDTGAAGAKGETGPRGAGGPAGAEGPTGAGGATGAAGAAGATGARGPAGNPGSITCTVKRKTKLGWKLRIMCAAKFSFARPTARLTLALR